VQAELHQQAACVGIVMMRAMTMAMTDVVAVSYRMSDVVADAMTGTVAAETVRH
jgi:hypothetical protein